MVHEDVARANGGPHVGRGVEAGNGLRGLGPVFEPGQVDRVVELGQRGIGREALTLVEVGGGELELGDERGADVGRQARVVFQSHRRPEATPAEPLLDAGDQIVGRAVRLQVGVTGDADDVAGEDLAAVVDGRQAWADDVLEEDKGVLPGGGGQGHEGRQDLGGDVKHGE